MSGIINEIVPYKRAFPSVSGNWSQPIPVMGTVMKEYARQMITTSARHQAEYPRKVMLMTFLVLYIRNLLSATKAREPVAKRTVKTKNRELPRAIQLLCEKGRLKSRNTMENNAAKVTV